MNHERLDIVNLIENNPLEKLSNDYQTKLLDRIKETFSDSDQQLFIASFYCYLKYDCKTDFIIDIDNVWKWLGFSRRDPCKRVIEKHFTKDIDYKILLHQIVEQVHGGHNKEKTLMNIETFKSLCLLANTERSKSVRKYYYKLEQLLHELLREQANELQNQLREQKTLVEEKEKLLLEKDKELEKYKEKVYEEVEKRGFVYVIKTDSYNFYKVGKTKDIVLKRVKGLQTGNVNNIQILLEFPTSNPDLLERCVHYILDRYRCNSNREFFDCNFEYIQKIIEICGNTIDTLKSTYQNIFNSHSINNIDKEIFINIDKFKAKEKNDHKDKENNDNKFYQWLDKNVILKKGGVLRLKDVVTLYTGKKLHPKAASILRLELEMYIKNKYTCIKSEYTDSSFNGVRYKGWINIDIT
jgi:phage anti-repressor protein